MHITEAFTARLELISSRLSQKMVTCKGRCYRSSYQNPQQRLLAAGSAFCIMSRSRYAPNNARMRPEPGTFPCNSCKLTETTYLEHQIHDSGLFIAYALHGGASVM